MLTFAIKKKRTPSIAPKCHTPTVSPMSHSLHLQQAKVSHILRGPTLQPKLTIGRPNDGYEQEADRVADEVMRMPEPRLQRQVEPEEEEEEKLQAKPLAKQITPLVQVQRQEEPEEEEETLQAKPLAEQITPLVQRQVEPEEEKEEPIQAKFADGAHVQRQEEEPEEEEEEPVQAKQVSTHIPTVTPNLASLIQSLKGYGQPLPKSVRTFFEPRFSQNFSHVRIHANPEVAETARALNAQAFTIGQDVMFGAGQYAPETTAGKRILAHELTHVVQQKDNKIQGKITIDHLAKDANEKKQYALKAGLDIAQHHEQGGKERVHTMTSRSELRRQEAEIEKEPAPTEAGIAIRYGTKETIVPEKYRKRQKEEVLARETERQRRLIAPYNPTIWSKRYRLLSPEVKARVVKQVNEWFRWEFPTVTWELDWNDPRDRPMARAWLRIRDKVMERIWPKYVRTLSEQTTAEIAGGLKSLEKTRPEEAERREPTFREMELRATYSKTIAYIYPRKIDEVESEHAPNTYETRVPDIRKPLGGQADYPGKYRTYEKRVRIPSGTLFGAQEEKTTITFIACVGNGVLYKKYLFPTREPAIFSVTADSFVIILWNLTEKTHGDPRARQTLLELLSTAE